jgi:ribosomal-protein-alanine N-acetyltransferase
MLFDRDSISSERLELRPIREADLEDLMEMNSDPEVTRFLPYATWKTAQDANEWLVKTKEREATGKAQQLVMQQKSDGRILGTVLLFNFDKGSSRLEIGYVLGRKYWQNGFAKEALHALLMHLFGKSGIRRVEAEVHPDNAASNALVNSLGFRLEGFLRDRWVNEGEPYGVNVYGLLAADLVKPPGNN